MIQKITDDIYEQVIKERNLTMHFQPIVSLDKERIVGCEALMRANYQNEPISAEAMFQYVREQKKEYDLDVLCRENAFLEFSQMGRNDILLFVNFEMGLLQEYLNHLDGFVKLLEDYQIQRERVVVEINEKRSGDNGLLNEFVMRFRALGFLIALDDVGEGYSNLNRIILTKPDIIKIDRNTIKDLNNNYYKYEIVRSITSLASRIGAVVIAEGVEEEEEVLSCLSLGITLIQGFYFSRAVETEKFLSLNHYPVIHLLSNQFQLRAENRILDHVERGHQRKNMLYRLIEMLSECGMEEYETELAKYLRYNPEIECTYIIDAQGKQVTNTMFNRNTIFKSTYLFSPARVNDYHILKPYYYVVRHNKSEIFVSDRYISAATGHFCETYSCGFYSDHMQEFIVCLDYALDE